MTYENATVRGLVVRRTDETLYTFRESVQKHFVASVSTCESAARLRDKLLSDFWLYTQTAVSEGQREPVKEYILARRGDTSAVDKLALLLAEQGMEVKRARAAFKNGGKEYPAASYVVSLAQPRKRIVRALLDPDNPMEQDFLKEQERRRKRKLPDEIYDVTGWSLPLLYNVESVAAAEASQGDFEILEGRPAARRQSERTRRSGLPRPLGHASRRALSHRGPVAGSQSSIGQQSLHASRPQVPHRYAHRAGEGERRGGA